MDASRANSGRMFDLFTEPFRIFAIDPTATAKQIEDAFGAASLNRAAPAETLNFGRAVLLDAARRLTHEVRYPLDFPASEIETFYSALSRDANTDELFRFADQLWPLARTNFTAHIASHRAADSRLLYALLESHASIDTAGIYATLKSARAVAELPAPSLVDVSQALDELLHTHAAAALVGYDSILEAAEPVLACTRQILARGGRHNLAALDVLLGPYRQAIGPLQVDAGQQIENLCAAIQHDPGDPRSIVDLSEAVASWTSLCSPLLAWEVHLGNGEPSFATPVEHLRSLIGHLAEKQQYELALELADLSRELFRMVPTTIDQLAEDAHLVRTLSYHGGVTQLENLIRSLEIDADPLIAALESDRFGEASSEPARRLWQVFLEATHSAPTSDVPWQLMRDFAIRCSNRPERAAAVASLMTGLLDYGERTAGPPQTLRALRDNLSFMRSFMGAEVVINDTKAVAHPNTGSFVSRLFRRRGSAHPTRLERKRSNSVRTAALVLTTLAGTGAAVYIGSDRVRSIWSRVPFVTARQAPASLGVETVPPIGTGQQLALEGVRYCHFQQERLNLLKPKVQGPDDARTYNLLIVDYNSRCSDYFYQDNDLKLVLAEVSAKKDLLEADAMRMLSSWSGHQDQAAPKN
jgi:hypothetical protein